MNSSILGSNTPLLLHHNVRCPFVIALNILYLLKRPLLPLNHISRLCIPSAKPANLPPPEFEQLIHALETAACRLRNEKPSPEASKGGYGGKKPESALGAQTTMADREEHGGHGAGVAILIDKMKAHNHAA